MVRGRGDEAPRFIRVKRERNEKTGKLLRYSLAVLQFQRLGHEDGALSRPRQGRSAAAGYVAFPKGSTTNTSGS
jgi:hypothetical protein